MNIIEYNDHDKLISFYLKRGIEELNEYPNKPVFSYIIRDDDELIAAATCSKVDDNFVLEAIAVKEEYVNNGIGTTLLKKVLERIKEEGAETVVANTKNIKFFEKNGFEVIDKSEVSSKVYSYCLDCELFQKTCNPTIMKRKV